MDVNNGSYDIKVNNTEKNVNLHVSGTAKPEEVQGFMNEYNSTVNKIQVSEFDLIVNCQDMSVETQDKIDKLAEIFKMYQQSGFKNIIFEVKSSNTILKMQLKRIIRNSGVDNAELLEV